MDLQDTKTTANARDIKADRTVHKADINRDVQTNGVEDSETEAFRRPRPSPVSSSSLLPDASPDRNVRRINVNFSESAYATLEQLAALKNKTMSDILRDAIQLEKWLSDAQEEGWHVLLNASCE